MKKVILVFAALALIAVAVDESKWKKCRQSGFCARNRDRNEETTPQYALKSGFVVAKNKLEAEAEIVQTVTPYPETGLFKHTVPVVAKVRSYPEGIFRVTVNEKKAPKGFAERFNPDVYVLDEDVANQTVVMEGDKLTFVNGGSVLKFNGPKNGFGFQFFVSKDDSEAAIEATKLLFEEHKAKPEEPKKKEDKKKDEKDEDGDKKEEEKEEEKKKEEEEEEKKEKKLVDLIKDGWDESFGGTMDKKPNGLCLLFFSASDWLTDP